MHCHLNAIEWNFRIEKTPLEMGINVWNTTFPNFREFSNHFHFSRMFSSRSYFLIFFFLFKWAVNAYLSTVMAWLWKQKNVEMHDSQTFNCVPLTPAYELYAVPFLKRCYNLNLGFSRHFLIKATFTLENINSYTATHFSRGKQWYSQKSGKLAYRAC